MARLMAFLGHTPVPHPLDTPSCELPAARRPGARRLPFPAGIASSTSTNFGYVVLFATERSQVHVLLEVHLAWLGSRGGAETVLGDGAEPGRYVVAKTAFSEVKVLSASVSSARCQAGNLFLLPSLSFLLAATYYATKP